MTAKQRVFIGKLDKIVDALYADDTDYIGKVLEYENREKLFTKCAALHVCCHTGSIKVLDLLLRNNIKPYINTKVQVDKDTICTPMEIACTSNKAAKSVKLLLLAGSDPNQKIEFFRNHLDVYPVHYAAMDLNLELIKVLIEKGSDLNKVAVFGNQIKGFGKAGYYTSKHSALSLAVKHAKRKAEHVECLKTLLQSGCDPNIPVDTIHFPLHVAVRESWFSGVKALLEHGADLKYPVSDNPKRVRIQPPVHQAIYNESIGILQLLFDHGLSPNEEPKSTTNCLDGETLNPLAFACYNNKLQMVEYLLMQGAHPNDPCATLLRYIEKLILVT